MAVNAEHQESQPTVYEGPTAQSSGDLRRIEDITIDEIIIGNRLRAVDLVEVQHIAKSIHRIGLQTPITVRETTDGDIVLVSGLHRLQAVKTLGWDKIPCRIASIDERAARLLEIAENLHRAELSRLERDEQLDEWMRLTSEQLAPQANEQSVETKEAQSAQSEPFESKRKDGRGHRKESGTRAAARGLGIDRNEAQRAMKRVQRIAPDIRNEIRAIPAIADSGVELDALANATPDQQAAAVAAVRSGKAKNTREALAQPELRLPPPMPREPELSLLAPPPCPSGDAMEKNPGTAISGDDGVANGIHESLPHARCIRLEPMSQNWDDARMSAAVSQLLQAAWSAPNAPRAGIGDPATAASLTIAELNLWVEKLQRRWTAAT